MRFPISGVETSPLVPFAVAYLVSALTSMGGVSGAFVLLPFQVSVLGFTGPAVTPTNHLFNVVAIPSAVVRYVREGRMLWPVAAVIVAGTIPGVVAGSLARIYLLPAPRDFKLFMGLVLLLIGARLVQRLVGGARCDVPAPGASVSRVKTLRFDWRRVEYEYDGRTYGFSTPSLALLTLVIGVIGGAYGVGGGAIIAPFLVSMYGLPVHTIAGATLLGTCLTSVTAVLLFAALGPLLGAAGLVPDWHLGLLFGVGGLLGMYTGAALQKWVRARAIEGILAVAIVGLGVFYVIGFAARP